MVFALFRSVIITKPDTERFSGFLLPGKNGMESAQEMGKIGFLDAHRAAKLEEHEAKINKILLGINALLECDRENKETLDRAMRKIKSCMDIVCSIEKQIAYAKSEQLDKLLKLIPVCCFATVGFCFAAIRIFSFIFS